MKNFGMEQAAIDWKAKWIWKKQVGCINEFVYFRKEMNITEEVKGAKIYVSAHHHFELYINGAKVSGYVTPAPTHPGKSKYYLCYDISQQIKKGMNAFCAVAHFIGGGGQNYVDGLPGFILQGHIDYDGGGSEILITDESWKVSRETPFRSGTQYQQNRKISAIEDYDARNEQKGWLNCGFDDSGWDFAGLSEINKESWCLKPQRIPEGKVYEIIVPEPVGIQQKSYQVFDAGKIVTGWPRLELPGTEGVRVMLRYSEDLCEDGSVKHNVANETSENYYDLYTMKGESYETWEPSFSYKAFRYVEVTGYPELLKPDSIKIISAGTGLTYKGRFNSSNKLLNEIYQACIQTQKNNVTGQMVDCPHREQAQYLADSDLQAETFIYNFMDSSVLKKVLLDFKDAQNEDGSFPFVFPTNVSNPEFNIKIPEWDLHFITLLWKIYYMYDSIDILQQCYDSAKKTVNYYTRLMDKETHLVPKAEGFPVGWNISDWPYPNIDETGEFLTVQNCLFYHVLGLMSNIASVLGLEDEAADFMENAGILKKSIQKYLYIPERKLFADSFGSSQSHQGTQVVAFQYGLIPEEDCMGVLDFIAQQGFRCSTLLSLNLLQVLFENGNSELAYKLLNRVEQPSWGYMISQGYKTIWEGFSDIESHCHAWNAYPARIMMEYLGGIKATAPGFREIDIKPYVAPDLQFLEVSVPVRNGDISVKWEKNDGRLKVKVCIPEGITGRIFLPDMGGDDNVRVISGAGEYIFTV